MRTNGKQNTTESGYPFGMRVSMHDKFLETDGSRSRLVMGLLVLILFLVLSLAWQANKTMQTHSATATRVIQDYARLVADEYLRRAMGEVGYYGYYTYMNVLRRLALEDSGFPFEVTKPEVDSPEERASRLVDYLFFVDVSNADFQTSAEAADDPGIKDYLSQRATKFIQQPLSESGFAIDHVNIDGQQHTFVISKVDETSRVFGFEVDRHVLSTWLRQAFEKDMLLPKSLAGGAVTNEFIYLRFVDDNDQVMFESRPDYDRYLLISKSIEDDYAGIFKAHTINAAIDPMIAESLIIGGLPRSRLPVLFAVILLTIGLLIAAIRQLQREQTLMKIRADFVSEVSHELRTPLTQIRMFTETLLFERFRTADDKRRALEIIDRESQRLIHLVENVLRFSDRPGNQRKLYAVNSLLAPLIVRVVNEFKPLAESAGATVQTELDPEATALVDNDALRQILLNLLDNAIKYGPNGQRVQIALKKNADGVQISVTDQGPGIPKTDRERIWGGYYRLDRERRSAIAGTGIGLAVVRELVTLHGGKTRVEDGPDGGACFVVEFPKAMLQEERATDQDRPSAIPETGDLP